MRSSPGLSKRQRPYSALQIISQAEAEDAGIFASQGGSLQDEAYTYTGGVSKCKNDREGAALK
ncbi:unknown [Dorea sp. CAG:317]|nr:unknown [Dorea sp. CAG:317]